MLWSTRVPPATDGARNRGEDMRFTRAPVVSANPNPEAPLAASVSFATDAPARVALTVSEGGQSWAVDCGAAFATRHRLPLVGLRPGRCHRISLTAAGVGDDGTAKAALDVTPPPLPADFPPVRVIACDPARRDPGVTVFNLRHAPSSEDRPPLGLLVAVDRWGEIVWTYRIGEAIGDVRRRAGDRLLYVADGRICEIDLMGNKRAEWYARGRWRGRTPPDGAVEVPAEMFHHAVIELPSGNFVACSIEIREIGGFPVAEDDPEGTVETARLVGDVIVEFTREGAVVNEYRLLDLLDPRRVCYGSRSSYWVRRGYPDSCDWSHANGLAHDPADDGIVVSLRHQDCLIKIDRATGALVWILGDHAGWRAPWSNKLLAPAPGLEWPYHQHDCSIGPTGTLLCFDNGNHRAVPPVRAAPPADCYSRAVEFAVDRDRRTVRQIWARGRAEDGTFSCFQSGVCRLPATGNLLVNYGGVCTENGLPSDRVDDGRCAVRQIEIDAASGDVVFELVVEDASPVDAAAYASFRVEHFPDFGGRRG